MKNKNVYFLGAGASAASEFKLPTTREFFKEFKVKEYPHLSRFIIKYFSPSLYFHIATKDILELEEEKIEELEGTIRDSELNLEETFSSLEFYLSKIGKFGKEPLRYLYDARKELKAYISRRTNIYREEIKSLNENRVWSDKYKQIFKTLSSQDTIITLNYDSIIECSLNRLWDEMGYDKKKEIWGDKVLDEKPHPLLKKLNETILGTQMLRSGSTSPFYRLNEIKTGVFLKLHGSINWVYCVDELCRNHFNIFPVDVPHELVAQFATFSACNVCAEPLEIAIVPPTMYKVYEKIPKLGFIWSIAQRELATASNIIIIGVSFAEPDSYLKGLFRSAITEGIKYVNGKPEFPLIEVVDKDRESCGDVCKKIKEIMGVDAKPIGNLDDYLKNKL